LNSDPALKEVEKPAYVVIPRRSNINITEELIMNAKQSDSGTSSSDSSYSAASNEHQGEKPQGPPMLPYDTYAAGQTPDANRKRDAQEKLTPTLPHNSSVVIKLPILP